MNGTEIQEKPYPTAVRQQRAFLVGIADQNSGIASAREYLEELRELTHTLGVPVCGETIAMVRQVHPKYYVGSGKLEEILEQAAAASADILIFDCELGPSQQRNLEKSSSMKVYDRQEVILDIFAARAQTKEAVLQVELARNRYYLPRLTGAWSHLSRQQGGVVGARGAGEKQIEYDRRMVKKRIAMLEEDLKEVRARRMTQRKERLRGRLVKLRGIHFVGGIDAVLRAGVHGTHKQHPPRELITVDASGQEDIHQFLVNGVFGTVDLVDEDDDGMHFAGLNRVHALLRRKPVHGVAVFVADERRAFIDHAARRFKQALFFILNALDGIIRQKTEFRFAAFILVLIRKAGDLALFERAALDRDAHAAEFCRDAFDHGGFADAVFARHQRRDRQIRLIGNDIRENRAFDKSFCFVDGDHFPVTSERYDFFALICLCFLVAKPRQQEHHKLQ